jgi:hypothetical protein
MKKLALMVSFMALTLMTFTRCDDDDDVSIFESTAFQVLNENMRELWSDHVWWTREVIVNMFDDLGGPQAADLLTAAEMGDTESFNTVNASWHQNADEIATFLHNANPDLWPLDHMKNMMSEHLDLTIQEATAHLNGDHAASVAAFDVVLGQIMEMADMLAEGIAEQFPDRF